ncbi:MAG: hypothetical protein ACK5KV_03025 [Bacteroides graminisolvens]|uniref:hypothetical protein n=1 Tax=Bacteroides graminisolvens TaxID=477666 RepID=UPI003A851D7C
MSFFKSIGKIASNVGKVVGKVVKTVAPVAALIPGVGTLASAAGSIVGNVLDPPKQEAIVNAVQEQGVIKVDKIESTIAANNPAIDSASLQTATKAMTQVVVSAVPTAKIDDSQSTTNISTGTKVLQWIKSNAILVLAGLGGLFFFMSNKSGSRRRNRY